MMQGRHINERKKGNHIQGEPYPKGKNTKIPTASPQCGNLVGVVFPCLSSIIKANSPVNMSYPLKIKTTQRGNIVP